MYFIWHAYSHYETLWYSMRMKYENTPPPSPAIYLTETALQQLQAESVTGFSVEPTLIGIMDFRSSLKEPKDVSTVAPWLRPTLADSPFAHPDNVVLLLSDATSEPPYSGQNRKMQYIPASHLAEGSADPVLKGKGDLDILDRHILDVPVQDFSSESYAGYLALGILLQQRNTDPRTARFAAKLMGQSMATVLFGRSRDILHARAADLGSQFPDVIKPRRPEPVPPQLHYI